MKVAGWAGLWFSLVLMSGCNNEQKLSASHLLFATDFAQKIIEWPMAPIIDVRGPSEFDKAHIQHAVNVDLNGGKFQEQLSAVDRTKPVFVYCLSGGRSAEAVQQMQAMGFQEVYELEGGWMKWRAANLPVATNSFSVVASDSGMTKEEFQRLLRPDKLVLVDFYADWCAPCRKMKPYLEEIAAEMKDKVELLRINADDHPRLCKDLNVTGLPTLHLYKDQALTWANSGFIEKAAIVKQLK